MLNANNPIERLSNKYFENRDIRFVFTKEKRLIDTYCSIREACYRSVKCGPQDFSGQLEASDYLSEILVLLKGNRVIGGGRLLGSSPEARLMLPVEQTDFMMKDVFPELSLEDKPYCEFGRIAVIPEYRDFDTINELCERLILRAIDKGYIYQFSMAPLGTSRLYQRVSSNLELPYPYIIHKHIPVPEKPLSETGGLKMYLGSLQLQSYNKHTYAAPNTLETPDMEAA